MEIWGRTTFRWRGRARNREVELFFATYSKNGQVSNFHWQWFNRNCQVFEHGWKGSSSFWILKCMQSSFSFETFLPKPIPVLSQITTWSASNMRGIFLTKIYYLLEMFFFSIQPQDAWRKRRNHYVLSFYLFYLFIPGLSRTTASSGSKMRGASVGTTPGLEHYVIIQTASEISQVSCVLTEKRNISQSDPKHPICWAIKFS